MTTPETKQEVKHSAMDVLIAERNAAIDLSKRWRWAALQCGLYRGDADVSTPEKWQSQQVNASAKLLYLKDHFAEMRDALEEAQRTIKLVNSFIDDLGKSNPGWLGKMALQRYDVMNEAYIALESAPTAISAILAKVKEAE